MKQARGLPPTYFNNHVQTETPGTSSQDEPQIKNPELACVRSTTNAELILRCREVLPADSMADTDAKGASRSLKPGRRRDSGQRPL